MLKSEQPSRRQPRQPVVGVVAVVGAIVKVYVSDSQPDLQEELKGKRYRSPESPRPNPEESRQHLQPPADLTQDKQALPIPQVAIHIIQVPLLGGGDDVDSIQAEIITNIILRWCGREAVVEAWASILLMKAFEVSHTRAILRIWEQTLGNSWGP